MPSINLLFVKGLLLFVALCAVNKRRKVRNFQPYAIRILNMRNGLAVAGQESCLQCWRLYDTGQTR